MCVQCMAGAMAAGAAVTGSRVMIVTRFRQAMTPVRKRALDISVAAVGVFAAAVLLGGA
ncbi:MAG: hypothetical protein ACKOQ0_04115 [Solirubrobacterales bacterium]